MTIPPLFSASRPLFAGVKEPLFPILSDDPAQDRKLRIQKHKEHIQELMVRYTRTEVRANEGQPLPKQYLAGLSKELVQHAQALQPLQEPAAFKAYLKKTVGERILNDIPDLQALYTAQDTSAETTDTPAPSSAPAEDTVPAWKARLIRLRERLRGKDSQD